MNICVVGIFDYSLVLVTLHTHYSLVTGGHCQYCYITHANVLPVYHNHHTSTMNSYVDEIKIVSFLATNQSKIIHGFMRPYSLP